MYYEVYIDVMFLVNFMMDVLILFSVKALMKMPGSMKRVIAGGLVGSGLSCLVVILRLPVGITMAVLHMLVSSGMVVCGLKIRSFSEFLKCYILLYFVSVLIGGILGMLKPYVKYTSLYFAVVIGCYYTIRAVWEFVLILFSVKALMKMPGSMKRVIAGGLVGSGLSCLVVILRLPVGITMAVLHMLVSSGMVVCGLKIRSFSEFLKCYILLYFVSVLIGGILGMLKPYVKYTSLYFAVVIGCYYTIRAVWEFLCRLQKEELKICRIILYQKGSCCEIRGLWDTGNELKDPLSEKPVCILEQSTIEKLTGEKENLKGFRLIPYRTVGKSGVMPVFELEKMYIVQKKQWIYHPLVGICEEQISEQGMYQMIINPEILGGRENGCKSSNAAAV